MSSEISAFFLCDMGCMYSIVAAVDKQCILNADKDVCSKYSDLCSGPPALSCFNKRLTEVLEAG